MGQVLESPGKLIRMAIPIQLTRGKPERAAGNAMEIEAGR